MDIQTVVTEFKRYLNAGGYASSTVVCYVTFLSYFTDYLETRNIRDIKHVTHALVREYHELVLSMPLAMETKALRMRPVKRLFEYLVDSHRLLIDPTEKIIETHRKNRIIPPVLSVDDITRLFAQPNLSFAAEHRNRAIMELLYSTGIRLAELLNLAIFDVDLNEKTLFIRKGKGRKQRVVPFGKAPAVYLREYLEKIRPQWVKRHPKERRLFVTNSGLPLTGQSIRGFLRIYRIKAGLKTPVSPHTFRRTCATHLIQHGADIRHVQQLLGHRHLKTTQAYTQIKPVDVKKIHSQTHPNAQTQKGDKTHEPE